MTPTDTHAASVAMPLTPAHQAPIMPAVAHTAHPTAIATTRASMSHATGNMNLATTDIAIAPTDIVTLKDGVRVPTMNLGVTTHAPELIAVQGRIAQAELVTATMETPIPIVAAL